MISIETINQLSDERGRIARQQGLEPYLIDSLDEVGPPFPFPHIGNHVPRGWKIVDKLFVDSSGFGTEGEPALTVNQFLEKLEVGKGYAIVEEGQFQVYVGVFEPHEVHWANNLDELPEGVKVA